MSNLIQTKKYLISDPNISVEYVAKTLGVTKAYAYNLISKGRKELRMVKQRDGTWTHKTRMQSAEHSGVWQPPAMIPVPEPKARLQGAREVSELIAVMTTNESIADKLTPPVDNVNHPAHYKVGGVETIDFIEAKQLNYNLGNVVKYVSRADHKGDRLENLEKARWYLEREISKLK
jgi:hypothetical protein